jgi:dTDP-4-dehydrorhamnose 3,5-epimerase
MMAQQQTEWPQGDIDGVIVKRVDHYSDGRGWLAELFRNDELEQSMRPAMGYVSMTRPDMARGPHAHREQTDCFAFVLSGRFDLRMWDNRPESSTRGTRCFMTVGEDNPVVVVVPPGVVHGYRNMASTDGLVLNFPNRLYAGEGRKQPVDEIRYEEEDSAAFSME